MEGGGGGASGLRSAQSWYKKKRRGRLRDFGAPAAAQPVNFSYVPWFLAHNKARFPYLFPSLFPEGLRHYVTL